jgi:hypothetical protein
MPAADDEDQREREIRRLTREIQAILPNPLTPQQHAFLDNVLVANLNGEF